MLKNFRQKHKGDLRLRFRLSFIPTEYYIHSYLHSSPHMPTLIHQQASTQSPKPPNREQNRKQPSSSEVLDSTNSENLYEDLSVANQIRIKQQGGNYNRTTIILIIQLKSSCFRQRLAIQLECAWKCRSGRLITYYINFVYERKFKYSLGKRRS